jgi:hypothetical protein
LIFTRTWRIQLDPAAYRPLHFREALARQHHRINTTPHEGN